MSEPTEYELSKWSRLIRLREEGKCAMCQGGFSIWRLQAHHIRPKSLYPDLALLPENGIALCVGCHMHIVHGGNSFVDVTPEGGRWRFFVPAFDRYVGLADTRRRTQGLWPQGTAG